VEISRLTRLIRARQFDIEPGLMSGFFLSLASGYIIGFLIIQPFEDQYIKIVEKAVVLSFRRKIQDLTFIKRFLPEN
jgi:hypothetical protein